MTQCTPQGHYIIPIGCDYQTYLATDHLIEVSTLSRWSNRFIPYPTHYRTAFAFSIILYPLQTDTLAAILVYQN
jgi:hypothetical protein